MAYYILKSYKLKLNPLRLLETLGTRENCFFLDSGLNGDWSLGRYSFLGVEPFFVLQTKGEDPFKKIRGMLDKYKISNLKIDFPFLGGAVGYFAYDLGLILEQKLKIKPKPDYFGIPDCFLGFYNTVIVIDHLKNLLHIFCLGFPEKKYHLAKILAEANFKKIKNLLAKLNSRQAKPKTKPTSVTRLNSNFSKENYLLAVARAKQYIRQGDIYQVNLTQQFNAASPLSALEIYRRLRRLSPSYFSAYFDSGDVQILSSSPERFLKLQGDRVITRPMKGTRPRSPDKQKDQRLKKELLESAKDRAELLMIVDLERNDLGRACGYNSIKVKTLRELEEYNTVFQTTATIEGRLDKDKDRMDLLRACFPGGSITGCPKIRAMEIIEELEPSRRLIYTGSFGYLSFSGDMDLNILIRTILKKGEQLCFGTGGGIVADSEPEKEYAETLVKAKAMFEAIGL